MLFQRACSLASRTHALRPLPSTLRPRSIITPVQWRSLSTEMRTAIDKAVASAPVVLFMKGTPETPQCGFSRASIQILGMQGVDPEKFTAFNVLEDSDLRQGACVYSSMESPKNISDFKFSSDELLEKLGFGLTGTGIKEYSEWPTIPQLYVEKEFIGGCDILMTMHQDGSLSKMLGEKGVLVPVESSGEASQP